MYEEICSSSQPLDVGCRKSTSSTSQCYDRRAEEVEEHMVLLYRTPLRFSRRPDVSVHYAFTVVGGSRWAVALRV